GVGPRPERGPEYPTAGEEAMWGRAGPSGVNVGRWAERSLRSPWLEPWGACHVMYPYIAVLLQQRLHIVDVSLLLAFFGVGILLANWMSGLLAPRFTPQRLVVTFLVALTVTQLALPLVMITAAGGALILLLWGMSFALLFIPQQQRLLSVAPEHANVLLALNNSGLYLGIAIGAALGGVALRHVAVTQLAWVGVLAILMALLIAALTPSRQRAWEA